MSHTLASQTIHIDDQGLIEISESNYSVQEILDATSETISYYGAKSDRFSITFILNETENSGGGRAALKAAVKANADVNLTLDTGSLGNVRILSFRSTRVQAVNQSAPVYKCQAELIEV